MLKNKVAIMDAPAPALTPDMLASIKKEDMKQAIVERFRVHVEAAAPRPATRAGQRSPYWQPADEEC
jgi:hypothetical protein